MQGMRGGRGLVLRFHRLFWLFHGCCVCVCVCKARDQLYLKSRDIIRDQVSGMGLVDRSVAGARRVTMRGGGSRMSCHGELCVSVCA